MSSTAPRVFTKRALSVEEQVFHLKARGLTITDDLEAAAALKAIGFYRFCGYALHWRLGDQGLKEPSFLPGITFQDVMHLAKFDRELRLHIIEAVERIEVALRSAFSNALGTAHGSHWYLDAACFKPTFSHGDLISRIKQEIHHDQRKSDRRDKFILHYYQKYDEPKTPPSWMVFESIHLGTMSKMFEGLKRSCQTNVSTEISLPRTILQSWLEMLTVLRNFCAHHARIWNRQFPIKPVIPKIYAPYFEYQIQNRLGDTVTEIGDFRLHTQLFVVHKFLESIKDTSGWPDRLFDRLHEYGPTDWKPMGFPSEWAGFPTLLEMEQESGRRKEVARAQRAAKAAS